MNYVTEIKEATEFISFLHRDSLTTLKLITNYNNKYNNFIKLDHQLVSDVVELEHGQHGSGIIISTVGHNLLFFGIKFSVNSLNVGE